ncbi:MAG: tonB dependent receptor family protein [Caulobacteraceae bacterium]|nr:tonB dependent receptor family protein [Caulobacteraceae bacterium]
MTCSIRMIALLGTTAVLAGATLRTAAAAEAALPTPPPTNQIEAITVVGTQIQGAKITGALPVAVVGQKEIQAVGAVSAGELFRALPQAGDVSFNEQTLGGTSPNAARGDVSTVTLRGLGQGNTLLLLNGRRVVQHPTSQTDGFSSPVFGYNANAIPVSGLERVEILRDGASALYGSDAVAGVVNNVLKSNVRGLQIDAQYGAAEGTSLQEYQLNALTGTSFSEGRGSITVFAGYTQHSDIKVGDQSYTASSDRRPLIADTPFANNASFNGSSTNSAWASFQSPVSFGTVRSNGVALTNASGVFHIQPSTNAGCGLQLGGGICTGTGNLTSTTTVNLRQNTNAAFPNDSVQPSLQRLNLFSFLNYELTPDIKAYSELGFYTATTDAWGGPSSPLSSQPITMAANAYWNPFGPVGSPNRLPGLNIPAGGLPLTLVSYSIVDAGPNEDKVVNAQYRALAGLKGQWKGWNWDSALLYNAATVNDTSTAISQTLFQQALNKTTPDAYNPFNGGNPATPAIGDATPNSASVINTFRIKETRANMTQLALWDFKLSRPDLFMLPGGAVGLASGVEIRNETYQDNRDYHQDGSHPYVDSVTGISYGSDLLGASPSPDVKGQRTVESVFGEVAIPVVGPEMRIPLIRAIDLQVAGRFENYSDVGAVAKPKIAGSWDVIEGVRFRGSWSQGFRAPNLETLHSPVLQRFNTAVDYTRCEEDLRAHRIASFSTCTESYGVLRVFAGNPALKPEESESWSFGTVLQPKFLPAEWGNMTVTVDRWHIAQTGVVGVFDYQNAITLDYLLRVQGKSNPNVVRAAATADDIAAAAGTGLAPVGQVITVNGLYTNLLPRVVEGVDIGVSYRLRPTPVGDFAFDFNYAKLTKFFQSPSADQQTLLSAQAAGVINKSITVGGAASQIGAAGNPSDKWSATLTWNYGPAEVGLYTQYTAPIYDTGVVDSVGDTWLIQSQLTGNAYGQWTFNRDKSDRTSFRLGVRNVADAKPPLSSGGYLGSVYAPQGRYWYVSVHKAF